MGASTARLLLRRPFQRPYLIAVSIVVAWNLWSFRASTLAVAYQYDASVHEEMVHFATGAIDAGRLPFTSWFPDIGLGSAQFLHYQSLAAVLTGLGGTVVGAGPAFRWSLYLLVALWPFAIYSSGRLFGLSRGTSMVAAIISPFIVSAAGVGFERGAYSWVGGFEVWTQLFGSWVLPFAWAATWRAFKDARFMWLAAALVSTTVALHFLCGYLALLGIIVLALVGPGRWRRRLARGAVLFGGSLAAAAWVIVPLISLSNWSAINGALAETPYMRGYGARQELEWLFTGRLFDSGRSIAVITAAVFLGVMFAVTRWRVEALPRALAALLVACLLLSFGPTTWGAVADVVPAHADLFFRRFDMGSQLAGIYLAGLGVIWIWQGASAVLPEGVGQWGRVTAMGCFAAAVVLVFSPAVRELARNDQTDATNIYNQRAGDATAGAAIAPLIDYVQHHPYGRAYAGLPGNWGESFGVDLVPVFKYLQMENIDEVSYQVPTSSLMLGPETDFDELNPADYALFGIRYLFLPTGMSPPVPAQRVMYDGPYSLWRVGDDGYVELVELTGTLSANRSDIGNQVTAFLADVGPGQDWTVNWPELPRHPEVRTPGPPSAPPTAAGVIDGVTPDLSDGRLSATITMARAGTVLFSVAYDPGWHASVNGHPAATEMLAPALVGVQVPRGYVRVALVYHGYAWYPELWLLGFAVLVLMAFAGKRWQSRVAEVPATVAAEAQQGTS